MGPAARVSAVVVNYNAGDYLRRAVRSLRDEGIDEIVVVDNASTDQSLDLLAADQPDGASDVVVRRGPNRGFGAGVNRGARDAPRREFLFVVNPDAVVQPGAVKALVDALDADAGVAIVGPAIWTPDGVWYPSARRFPSLGDALGHAFLGVVWPANPFTRRYRMLDADENSSSAVDWLSGSCLMVRRSAWDDLGGFDESYFMYAEDVDICWRAAKRGWRVAYEPGATIVHAQGVSTDQVPYRMIAAHHRSLFRFAKKRAERPVDRLVLPVVGVGLAVRTVLAWLHRLVTGRFRSADL